MSGYINKKKKIIPHYLGHIIFSLFILLTAGCGSNAATPASADNNAADATRTGSASFSVKWHTKDTISIAANEPTRSAIADCTAIGVESISCKVYDENNNPVASGGPWACTDHGAIMDRIPEGLNMTFTIFGWDTADGNIIYQGASESPVTIEAGKTTDAGTINAIPFVPTGLAANATAIDKIDLAWDKMGVPNYRIYQDGAIVATPASPKFSIIDLTPDTRYCFTVSAIDVYGNESGHSSQACAATGAENDKQAPTVPAALSAAAVSASQIDINWEESTDDTGVSGYRIYQNNQLVNTATAPPFSHMGLQEDTEYCYTVEAFDATGNRSAQSEPACATTETSPDTDPPTQPQGLIATDVSAIQIDLSWTASNDNVGISHYRIYRGDENIGQTTATRYSDTPVQPNIEYCYTVEAYDAAGNVSKKSVADCATPQAIINVNIDSDFRYVAEGSPMKLSPGNTTADSLDDAPIEEEKESLIEPPYRDLYERYSVSYGNFRMGNTEDNIISFAIVSERRFFAPTRYALYIDSNNNEDLTDDVGPYANQDATEFAVEVPLNAEVITDSGNRITRPYQLYMWISNGVVQFYATCHYAGEIQVGGQTFSAVAFESFNHDALYRENGLFIDLDDNGSIDVETEYFQDQQMVTVGGQPYELMLNYP